MLRVIKKAFICICFKKKHPEPDAQDEIDHCTYEKEPFRSVLKFIFQNDHSQNFNDYQKNEK